MVRETSNREVALCCYFIGHARLGIRCLACTRPTIVRIAYTHVHPLRFFIAKSCATGHLVDSPRMPHQGSASPRSDLRFTVRCVDDRQSVFRQRAGAMMGQADGKCRSPCSKGSIRGLAS